MAMLDVPSNVLMVRDIMYNHPEDELRYRFSIYTATMPKVRARLPSLPSFLRTNNSARLLMAALDGGVGVGGKGSVATFGGERLDRVQDGSRCSQGQERGTRAMPHSTHLVSYCTLNVQMHQLADSLTDVRAYAVR